MGNEHGRPRDIAGEVRQAFTSTADTAFDVCLQNQLVGHREFSRMPRNPSPEGSRGLSFCQLNFELC